MDSLTHAALGACLGELTAGHKIGKRALLWGALVSNAPDIDVVCYLWMSPTQALLAHRGVTHSIFYNILLAFFLAFILNKILKRHSLSFRDCLLFVGPMLFFHLFLDLFNAYGTGIFEPFSERRISFNALYIIDPFFTLPPLISGTALLVIKRNHFIRLNMAKGAILASALYLVIGLVNKTYVNSIAGKNLSESGISPASYFTSPTPFNNVLWYIVVQDKKRFLTGYYSIFDADAIIDFEQVNKNDSLLRPFSEKKDLENLKRFSQGYYCANQKDSSVMFNDLRFGRDEGWSKSHAGFNFNFDFQKDRGNLFLVQRGRFKSLSWKTTKGIISRIINGRPASLKNSYENGSNQPADSLNH